jgi:pre-mRNA-splicing factor CWC22
MCWPCALPLQVGAFLQDVAPAGLHSVFERFRAILHEGAIDRRCQYMIEGLFAIRKVSLSAAQFAVC